MNFRMLSALMAMVGLGKAVERHNVAPGAFKPDASAVKRGPAYRKSPGRRARFNRNGRWGADTPCRCGFGLRTRDCERVGHECGAAEREIARLRALRLGLERRAA